MSVPAGSELPGVLPSFKRILFATDFSAYSAAAAPFAALLADYYDAEVFVAYVIPTDPKAAEGEAGDNEDAVRAQMERFLAQNPLGETPRQVLIEHGHIWDVLADVIEQREIDLVVLGTRGRRGVGKLMMGSVAEHIFQIAPCPVLSIGPRVRKSWGTERKLARILYATDLSDDSLKALPYALSLVRVSRAELLLLHVVEASTGSAPPEYLTSLHDRLNSLIPPEARAWCRWDTVVAPGDPADVILRTAVQQNVDFIVMGGHRVEGRLYAVKVPVTTAYRVVSRADRAVLRVRA